MIGAMTNHFHCARNLRVKVVSNQLHALDVPVGDHHQSRDSDFRQSLVACRVRTDLMLPWIVQLDMSILQRNHHYLLSGFWVLSRGPSVDIHLSSFLELSLLDQILLWRHLFIEFFPHLIFYRIRCFAAANSSSNKD